MNALIYCRVSSQRQVNEGHGLDSQEKRCRDYAKNKGYSIVKVFPDEGISGKLFERPAMKELIAYLDSNKLEKYVIIFDDLSRFAREIQTHIQLKTELVSRGAKLECLNFSFEDSEESEFAEMILAASNQYQRKSNARQVKQKMKARFERGYWPFMLPMGLINKKDPAHGKLAVPSEPYSSCLKHALEKFRDGILQTPEEVRQYLHLEFEKVGIANRPSLSTVQEILKNPLYAGYMEYPRWNIPFMKAKHDGFISLETFNLVQERLQGRSKPWKRRDYSTDFPLRPFVLCAECKHPMTASWNTGRKNLRYPNYFCRNKSCIYCWKTISKHKIEPEFEALLSESKPVDGYVDLALDVLNEQWQIRLEQYSENREKTFKEVEEIDNLISSYLEQIGRTQDIDLKALYEQKIKELMLKKKQGEGKLSAKKYTAKEFGTASEKVLKVLKNPMSMWKSEEYNDKRTILLMYFEDQLQYDYNNGFGTANLAYPVRLINALGQAKNASVEMSGSEPECEKN